MDYTVESLKLHHILPLAFDARVRGAVATAVAAAARNSGAARV